MDMEGIGIGSGEGPEDTPAFGIKKGQRSEKPV